MSTNAKPAGEAPIDQPGTDATTSVERPVAAKRKASAAKLKVKKVAKRSPKRSRPSMGKLVCRYCGSDDLAPSFKKRRDARCRACFKKRYRSNRQSGKRTRKAK